MIGEYHSPLEVKHENRNRQRKNCDRKPNKRRRKNLRLEEICRIQSKSSCLRKQNQKDLRIDQWGVDTTPKVWRSKAMVSTHIPHFDCKNSIFSPQGPYLRSETPYLMHRFLFTCMFLARGIIISVLINISPSKKIE